MGSKQARMQDHLHYRMRVTMGDGRQMVGQMLAFDKHMNIVLADTEEFRKVTRKGNAPGATTGASTQEEVKRTLGLTIVRGANVISCSVDGPPPADPASRLGPAPAAGAAGPTMSAGPGISRPAGRGLPTGLTGPAAGVGGPAPPGGFGPPGGFPGAGGPPGFGRGGPPAGGPPGFGGPPGGFQPPAGFQPPPGFQGPPGGGRGFPPGFGR